MIIPENKDVVAVFKYPSNNRDKLNIIAWMESPIGIIGLVVGDTSVVLQTVVDYAQKNKCKFEGYDWQGFPEWGNN